MPRYKIINDDFRKVSTTLSKCDTMFADPPDNISLNYADYDDGLELEEYLDFLNDLIDCGINLANTSYISFNAKWMTEMGGLLEAFKTIYHDDIEIRWLIQGFTFGEHRKTDYANNFRPIIRIRHTDAPLFPDNVRIESWRMKHGDKRANTKGRVPGDVWFSDFMEYARVVGNSKQRRSWMPTQLNEALVEDCLLMSTPYGGLVFDPFMGSGTTLRVCLANDWSCITCDICKEYCENVAKEHQFQKFPTCWIKDLCPKTS